MAGVRALKRIHVVSNPGLERCLEKELQALRIPGHLEAVPGGVLVNGTNESLWRVCLQSRIAESVRVRLGDPFYAPDVKTLGQRLGTVPWGDGLHLDGSAFAAPEVKVVSFRSRLYHTRLVEDAVWAAVGAARIGRRSGEEECPSPGSSSPAPVLATKGTERSFPTAPDLRVSLRHNECQVSIGATGLLHLRGYRKAIGDAPLRETLAAACVLATPFLRRLAIAAHEGEELVVWDPFCGSGSLLLEALGIAMGLPPGSDSKRYPFASFPDFNKEAYEELIRTLAPTPHPALSRLKILGSDTSGDQILRARRNLRRFQRRMFGVSRIDGDIVDGGCRGEEIAEDAQEDGGATEPPPLPCSVNFEQGSPGRIAQRLAGRPTVVMTNVPYGILSGSGQQGGGKAKKSGAVEAHAALGRMLRQQKADWRGVFCLAANIEDFRLHTGAEWTSELRFLNGGRWVDLLQWTGRSSSASSPSSSAASSHSSNGFDGSGPLVRHRSVNRRQRRQAESPRWD